MSPKAIEKLRSGSAADDPSGPSWLPLIPASHLKRKLGIIRYELTDPEWTAIEPMLPNNPRGIARVNDPRVPNCIFRVSRIIADT